MIVPSPGAYSSSFTLSPTAAPSLKRKVKNSLKSFNVLDGEVAGLIATYNSLEAKAFYLANAGWMVIGAGKRGPMKLHRGQEDVRKKEQ